MTTRTAATAVLLLFVAVACRSSDPVPPSLPLVVPEPEEPPARDEPTAESDDSRDDARDEASVEPTYVVAADGDDAAAGTAESPWRTLQHAASKVEPGDTVRVRAGRYRGFQLETSGEPDAPIRFVADKGVVIEDPAYTDGINLEGASHVEIRGFKVVGAERAGIRAVMCEHVTIRDNIVDKNGKWGILTGFCDDLRIVDNEASRSKKEHGIYVGNTCTRPLVQGNELWGNNLAGLHMNGDVNLGGEGVITEARILDNVIFENGRAGASGINLDGVRDSLIANNLLYGNKSTGIALYRVDGGKPAAGNVIVHNTVVMPATSTRWALWLKDGATNNTIYNNILVAENPRRGAIAASRDSLEGLRSDANLVTDRFSVDYGDTVMDLDEWRKLTGQDADSGSAPTITELFVDARGGDFRLASKSPARAAGKRLPREIRSRVLDIAARDLVGTARPERDAPDLGCYQARSSAEAEGS